MPKGRWVVKAHGAWGADALGGHLLEDTKSRASAARLPCDDLPHILHAQREQYASSRMDSVWMREGSR